MDDLHRESVRSEDSSYDPYLEAACWERSRKQQQLSRRVLPDEASWARLERQPMDGMLYRWCSQALLRLRRRLLSVPNQTRAAAAPDAKAGWRRPVPSRVARSR